MKDKNSKKSRNHPLVATFAITIAALALIVVGTVFASKASAYRPPENDDWISPAIVTVNNLVPGKTLEWPVTIHNGNDSRATFILDYATPANPASGYAADARVRSWVTISEPAQSLGPKETKTVKLTIEMPADTPVTAKDIEFYISVFNNSQTGLINEMLEQTIQIHLR